MDLKLLEDILASKSSIKKMTISNALTMVQSQNQGLKTLLAELKNADSISDTDAETIRQNITQILRLT